MEYEILHNLYGIENLRNLSGAQLEQLADELRDYIIDVVSKNGGHLAPNLGVVELTIALLSVYNPPNDRIVWDVGHQCYPYKILTDRKNQFPTIRTHDGIAGFPKRCESCYDHFGCGHASTSISAALGFAAARDLKGEDHNVIGIIGDGSLTGGMAFEALNNAGSLRSDLLVIFNDNKMSISPNVGAVSKYLTNVYANPKFTRLKNDIWDLTGKISLGEHLRALAGRVEESFKNLFVPGLYFEQLGFEYFGPIDGHDIEELLKILERLKSIRKPKLLHIITEKGRGYAPAEQNRPKFHGIGEFDRKTGINKNKSGIKSYTQVFGESMVELGEKYKNLTTITAAMALGTGLQDFSKRYPKRFFDVGIAEEHAVTFSTALALEGIPVVCALYSTFMQRGYDQLIHDAALQKAPVVFALDRAGIVGADGPTHHGAFDISFMRTVPDLVVSAPADENELRLLLYTGINYDKGPFSVRYPRGEGVGVKIFSDLENMKIGSWEIRNEGDPKIVILATGTMVYQSMEATKELTDLNPTVVNCRFIKPFDETMLSKIANEADYILTVEENALNGGFGEMVLSYLNDNDFKKTFKALGIPDEFVSHGNTKRLLKELNLDASGIAHILREMISKDI